MKTFSILSKKGISLLVTATFVLSAVAAIFGQVTRSSSERMWTAIEESSLDQSAKRLIVPLIYQTMRLDRAALTQTLASAPMEFTRHASQNPIIHLPMPDGSLARFRFEQSPVVEEGLAAKYPELKMTYRAQGIDDRTATSRFDWLPTGFHAIILSASGTVLIDPYAEGKTADYITYWKKDAANLKRPFVCEFVDPEPPRLPDANGGPAPAVTSGTTLRTYRLALAATNEYCVAVGSNTVAGSLAAEILVMNRVNGVYERDLAMHMNIVANNNLITYAGDNLSCGGPCTAGNDPYTNGNGSAMLTENQNNCNAVIGSTNYDIGHVFSTGGGGVANLGVPCGSSKARGVTGQLVPLGDPFAIDYVAHEMGHQWGANHTFNGASGNCAGGNRSATHSYEPGSGITIMAYAGICSTQDLAAHSIDTFHVDSLQAIVTYSQTGAGNTCAVSTATGNTAPTVTGPGNFNIPKQTPFSLTASATDPNGDSITYDWEEFDTGGTIGTTAVPNTDSDGTARPIFRPYLPAVTGTRTFPSLQYILNNANVPPATTGIYLTGELLPAITRTMVFQVVARDNRANGGGINSATSNVSVTSAAGPFAVTAPNTAVTWAGSSIQTVTWNVASTTAAPVNAANVKISLSTDGGNTFPTVLLASTPNDGTESVTIPNTPTTTARIRVEAVGNIFFDISDTDFTITGGTTPTPTPVPTLSPTPSPTPTSSATPTPTPPPLLSISGNVTYCSNPALPPVPGVTMTLTGSSPAPSSTPTNGSGNYTLTGLASGGSYTVTPSRAALAPGVDGINGSDVVRVLQHVLQITPIPPGCALDAADVDTQAVGVDGSDIVAIVRFYLGLPNSPTSRAGQYRFTPANRAYNPLNANQTGQDYTSIVYGDTSGASGYVHRTVGSLSDDADRAREVSSVAAVTLPELAINPSRSNIIAAVTTTTVEATDNLVGFQGDFTFDERVVTFEESQPVQAAGLTAGNWNVVGHVLAGAGPVRTLRLLGYSNDFTPLSGKGTLFELRMTRASKAAGSSQLIWAAPPHDFRFIAADLSMQQPGNAASDRVVPRPSLR